MAAFKRPHMNAASSRVIATCEQMLIIIVLSSSEGKAATRLAFEKFRKQPTNRITRPTEFLHH